MKILIVEDESKLALNFKKGLEQQSYEVEVAIDGLMGKSMALGNTYDIIIMDVKLPKMNGFELIKALRCAKLKIPILMITCLASIEDKLKDYESGVDAYLIKPFTMGELVERLQALYKKRYDIPEEERILKLADLQVNLNSKMVQRAGTELDLTAKEFALLAYLLTNQGNLVSRAEIAENVWKNSFDPSSKVIDVYINFLRKKVDTNFPVRLIHPLAEKGYLMKQ
ncbi:response regulator transcription factor [Rhodocytophaga rosea]|uniref:Response regulator transcription factor n=1 Tax=Rhodocytophaga rosea TaxID=2704465 RepID=A0A6C0GTK7_9BACT|nr:response regulator transcription factor [Rhodocytophaga rosea]QHT71499.1 response regulator transcription factor [Rhodocytophaga rosea]